MIDRIKEEDLNQFEDERLCHVSVEVNEYRDGLLIEFLDGPLLGRTVKVEWFTN